MDYFIHTLLPTIASGLALPALLLLWRSAKDVSFVVRNVVTLARMEEAIAESNKRQSDAQAEIAESLKASQAEIVRGAESRMAAKIEETIREANNRQIKQINGTYVKPDDLPRLLEPHLSPILNEIAVLKRSRRTAARSK